MSKRLASRYLSGPSRNWIKTKCPDCKRDYGDRHKLFEAPRKPELRKPRRRSSGSASPFRRPMNKSQSQSGSGNGCSLRNSRLSQSMRQLLLPTLQREWEGPEEK